MEGWRLEHSEVWANDVIYVQRMRFRQNVYGRTSVTDFLALSIRYRLSCIRFRSRFSLVQFCWSFFSPFNFILVALVTELCEILQNTHSQIWNELVTIRWTELGDHWQHYLIYSIKRRSWMNAAFAADRSKVTNERCSRINAAPYHNNAASTRGL